MLQYWMGGHNSLLWDIHSLAVEICQWLVLFVELDISVPSLLFVFLLH